jgi:transposase-like protein
MVVVRKTNHMLAKEREFGQKLETLLPQLYEEESGHITAVAKRLGIHPGTLYQWIGKLGMAHVSNIVKVA